MVTNGRVIASEFFMIMKFSRSSCIRSRTNKL